MSGDFQKVDIVYSKHLLSAGHEYEVIFNSNQEYPQIAVVLQELVRAEHS